MDTVKIVIADAHETVAEALHLVFEREYGLCVLGQACTIDETLILLRKASPDVLLLGLALADGNGLDLIPLLRNQHPEVRVLLFTGLYTEEVAMQALKAGAHGCFSKGEPLKALVKAIRAVYRGEIWAPRRLLSQALEQAQAGALGPESGTQLLTDREREICRLVARGETNKEIASALFITEKTVKSHLNRIFRKLHLRRRIDLVLHQTGNRKDSPFLSGH